jgi:hypothetical protein
MDLTPSPLPDSPDQQEILFEFRAGKMTKTGTRVTPDPRKGLVRLLKGEDTLTHFQWWDRGLNSMEDVSRLLYYSVFFDSIGCRLCHIFCVWTLFLSQIILCGIVVAMQQQLCMFFGSVISSFMEK